MASRTLAKQIIEVLNFSSIHSVVNEVTHFTSTLVTNYTDIPLPEKPIFQWIIVFVGVWKVLHTVLFKLTKIFLQRVGVDEIKTKLLSKAVWDLCFFFMSAYMIVENLNLDIVKFTSDPVRIIHEKTNDCFLKDNYCMEKHKVARSEVLFVIVTAYFIHSISWTVITTGFKNVEFLQKELITMFFILTRVLRCTEYGMMVLLYLHSYHILEELTKLICTLGLICRSNILRNITKCFYVIQIVYWCWQYLHQYPQLVIYMFSRKLDTNMVQTELYLILLVPAYLTFYYFTSIYMSSANRLILHFIHPAGNSSASIEYLVFGELEENPKWLHGDKAKA